MSQEVGRNDPCPCGSGKKYKKCCLSKAPPKKTFTAKSLMGRIAPLQRMVVDAAAETARAAEETQKKFQEQHKQISAKETKPPEQETPPVNP